MKQNRTHTPIEGVSHGRLQVDGTPDSAEGRNQPHGQILRANSGNSRTPSNEL